MAENGTRSVEAGGFVDPDVSPARDILGNRYSAYRPYGMDGTRQDLPAFQQDQMIRWARHLDESNPLANALTRVVVDMIMGGQGITFRAGHEELQNVLDEFWDDGVNSLETRQFVFAKDFSLTGELFLPFVTDTRGFVEISNLDPYDVKTVTLNSGNPLIVESVVLKDLPGGPDRILPVPIIDRATKRYILPSPSQGVDADGVFVARRNAPPTASRGRSDLISSMNWLSAHNQFLHNLVQAAILRRSIVFQYVLAGKSDEEIKKLRAELSPPSGLMTFLVTNEHWTVHTPQLKEEANDAGELARNVRLLASLPSGVPDWLLFSAADANRSTAQAQSWPLAKHYERRQLEVKAFWRGVLTYVRDQAIAAGTLSETMSPAEQRIDVSLPSVNPDDAETVAKTLQQASQGLLLGEQQGYASNEEAGHVWRHLTSRLGVELSGSPPPTP